MAFLTCGRWATRPVLSSLSRFPTVLNTAQYAQAAGVPKLTYKPYEPPKEENYDVKNAKLHRPLSPHLSIYAPNLGMMLSISHRATGMILSGFTGALGIGALVLPHDISEFVTMIEGLNLSPATIFLAKAAIAFPFAYHFANGCRHLYWDTAKGLTTKELVTTGYAMLAASLAITIFLASL